MILLNTLDYYKNRYLNTATIKDNPYINTISEIVLDFL